MKNPKIKNRVGTPQLLCAFLLFPVILCLAACDGHGWQSSNQIIGRGTAYPSEEPERGPLYCYRTLGKNDCYKTPQKDREENLEAFHGPDPRE